MEWQHVRAVARHSKCDDFWVDDKDILLLHFTGPPRRKLTTTRAELKPAGKAALKNGTWPTIVNAPTIACPGPERAPRYTVQAFSQRSRGQEDGNTGYATGQSRLSTLRVPARWRVLRDLMPRCCTESSETHLVELSPPLPQLRWVNHYTNFPSLTSFYHGFTLTKHSPLPKPEQIPLTNTTLAVVLHMRALLQVTIKVQCPKILFRPVMAGTGPPHSHSTLPTQGEEIVLIGSRVRLNSPSRSSKFNPDDLVNFQSPTSTVDRGDLYQHPDNPFEGRITTQTQGTPHNGGRRIPRLKLAPLYIYRPPIPTQAYPLPGAQPLLPLYACRMLFPTRERSIRVLDVAPIDLDSGVQTTLKVVKCTGEDMLWDGIVSCGNVGLEFFECVKTCPFRAPHKKELQTDKYEECGGIELFVPRLMTLSELEQLLNRAIVARAFHNFWCRLHTCLEILSVRTTRRSLNKSMLSDVSFFKHRFCYLTGHTAAGENVRRVCRGALWEAPRGALLCGKCEEV
ncbi:hypothetical protein PR048_005463 [Dryococelus australis]|uniref:Uncharacterized protein n=1 Tax=Dryococelus australis TaxID=614101 RepID=A0ABQ9I8T7_9NEOP|nr:hypothetical protein PR048_005463 [Dryococelus australis]